MVEELQAATVGFDHNLIAGDQRIERLIVEVHEHVLNAAVLTRDRSRLALGLTRHDARLVAYAGEGIEGTVGSVVWVLDGGARLDVIGSPAQRAVADPHVVGDAPPTPGPTKTLPSAPTRKGERGIAGACTSPKTEIITISS